MMGIKRITQSKRTSIRFGSFIACIAILSLLPTAVAHAQLAGLGSYISGAIYSMLIAIGSIFTLLGGLLLDYSVGMLVVGMGELMTGNIGFAVDQLWTIVRDIFNIVFIFSLIALGIQTILKSDDASTQRAIGYLIIAALLINFSLFITKTIVDFANIAAYQIVEAMPDGGTAYTSVPLSTGETFGDTLIRGLTIEGGITGPFMDRMRLSSYAENGQFEILTGRDDGGVGLRTVMFGFLMMLLMIVAGFVFAAGAFLLIARFVTLIFLMIFSPILFLGWIYPSFSKYSKQYWDTFLRNAFVAPAYMFMIYLSMRVFSALGYGGQTGAGSFAAVMDQSQWGTGIFMMIMYFVIIAGFLIGSVIVAQKIGAAGASTAMKITGTGTAFAYRNTVGRGARGIVSGLDRLDARISRAEPGEDANRFTRTLHSLGKNTLRNTVTNSSLRGGVDSVANKGSFQTPFGTLSGRSLSDANKETIAQNQRAATQGAILSIKDKLTRKPNQTDDQYNAAVQQAFADMTNGQLLEIADTADGAKLIKEHAHLLTSTQIKAIADSDKFNDSQTAEFAKARGANVKAQMEDSGSTLELKNASKDQLTSLGVDNLKDPKYAVRLTDDQIKNLEMVDAYKNQIKDARKAALTDIIINGATITDYAGKSVDASEIAKMKPKDIAALPDTIFNHAGKPNLQSFLAQLPVSALTEIASQKNKETQANIRTYLTNIGTTNTNMRDWLKYNQVGMNFGV